MWVSQRQIQVGQTTSALGTLGRNLFALRRIIVSWNRWFGAFTARTTTAWRVCCSFRLIGHHRRRALQEAWRFPLAIIIRWARRLGLRVNTLHWLGLIWAALRLVLPTVAALLPARFKAFPAVVAAII